MSLLKNANLTDVSTSLSQAGKDH